MDKKVSLILSLLITLLLFFNYFFLKNTFLSNNQRELAIVSRVIDGDTLELDDGRIVRLLNINTPEKKEPGSNESTSFLKNLENSEIELVITGKDKYKRYLARIYAPNYINLEIVRLGLATKYLVFNTELAIFSLAEKYAIDNEVGIWKKSSHYGCIDASIDQQDEILTLQNSCSTLNITNWMLRDESRKKFFLSGIITDKIVINSNYGQNTKNNFYLGSSTDVWNDDRDTVYLLDDQGKIILYKPYGYP